MSTSVSAYSSLLQIFSGRAKTLLRSSALVFFIAMVGNVAAYLYQFGMGRMLNVSDFGTLNAILSLSNIIAVPATTITIVKAKHIARLLHEQAWGQIRLFYNRLLLKTLLCACFTVALTVIFHRALQEFLHVDELRLVLLFSALVFWSLLVALNTGFFQGLQRFGVYAALGAGNAVARFLLAVLLVWAGASLVGALLGVVLASALAFAASYILIRNLLTAYREEAIPTVYALKVSSTVVTLSFLTLISFADMVLVKHLYSPEQAGIYAGVSVLGRAILYLPAAITQVLLPKASATGRDESHQLIVASTLVTAGISIAGVSMFYVFSEPLLRLLLGSRYHGGASLLGLYGLAMLFFAVLTLFVNFCLARDIQGINIFLGITLLVEVSGVLLFKRDLQSVPLVMAAAGFLACALLFLRIRNETRAVAVT